MRVFAETSFLCSIYRKDKHTPLAVSYLKTAVDWPGTSTLVLFEFRQSLQLQNFQHLRQQTIGTPVAESGQMMADLQTDLHRGRLGVAPVDWPAVHHLAETLSAKHTATVGHRFADILHVATALQWGAREFLTFDDVQRALAEAEGLTVPL